MALGRCQLPLIDLHPRELCGEWRAGSGTGGRTVYVQGSTSTRMQAPRAPKPLPAPGLPSRSCIYSCCFPRPQGVGRWCRCWDPTQTGPRRAPWLLSKESTSAPDPRAQPGPGCDPGFQVATSPARLQGSPQARARGERRGAWVCSALQRGSEKFWVPGLRQGAGDPISRWKDDRVLGAQRRPGSLAPSPAPPFPTFWVLTHNLGTPAVKGAPNASAPA